MKTSGNEEKGRESSHGLQIIETLLIVAVGLALGWGISGGLDKSISPNSVSLAIPASEVVPTKAIPSISVTPQTGEGDKRLSSPTKSIPEVGEHQIKIMVEALSESQRRRLEEIAQAVAESEQELESRQGLSAEEKLQIMAEMNTKAMMAVVYALSPLADEDEIVAQAIREPAKYQEDADKYDLENARMEEISKYEEAPNAYEEERPRTPDSIEAAEAAAAAAAYEAAEYERTGVRRPTRNPANYPMDPSEKGIQ
jgi:hypothetical protein